MSDISGTTATSNQPTAVLPAGDTASASSTSSSTSDGLGSNGVNADTFLKLLVAQMQYQNPDNPVDSTQFLSQTADFEEVQELGSLQTSLASLVSSQQAGAATSMLGQKVTGTDADRQLRNGGRVGDPADIDGPVAQRGQQHRPLFISHQRDHARHRHHRHREHGTTGTTGTGTTGTGTTGTGTGTATTGTATGPARPTTGTGTTGAGTTGTGTTGTGTTGTGTYLPHHEPKTCHKRTYKRRARPVLRSLFSGVSGLDANQELIDTIGNDIANINTTGYKSNEVQFEDLLDQTIAGATAPTIAEGGVNPTQVGLGVKVAGVEANFTQGTSEQTGNPLDLSIQGNGFFIANGNGQTVYTQAGSLELDGNGNLVTPDGYLVQGWAANANGDINTSAPLANLTIPSGQEIAANATTGVTLGGNLAPQSGWTPPTTGRAPLGPRPHQGASTSVTRLRGQRHHRVLRPQLRTGRHPASGAPKGAASAWTVEGALTEPGGTPDYTNATIATVYFDRCRQLPRLRRPEGHAGAAGQHFVQPHGARPNNRGGQRGHPEFHPHTAQHYSQRQRRHGVGTEPGRQRPRHPAELQHRH